MFCVLFWFVCFLNGYQRSYLVNESRCRAVRFAVVSLLPSEALADNRCSVNLCLMNHVDCIVLMQSD